MANGLDTTFLVCAEVKEHPGHSAARELLASLLREGESLGLAPQVLAEFVHVVTDARRFEFPLEMNAALERAGRWWDAEEITRVFPTAESTHLFLQWMGDYRLGRKRLLDTQLAATYSVAGLRSIVTTNPRDFLLLDGVSVRVP